MSSSLCQAFSGDVKYVLVDFLFSNKIASQRQERIEQRYGTKFCKMLGDSQAETIRKIGKRTLSLTRIKERLNCFKDGRMSKESEPHFGRPCTS